MAMNLENSMAITFRDDFKFQVAEINSFYLKIHNNIRTNREFEWEFFMSPHGEASYISAVNDNNNIIGTMAVIPVEMINSEGKIVLSGKPEDTMVDIFARIGSKNMDILKEIYKKIESESVKRGIRFLWGFTYATKPFIRLGFECKFHSLQGVYIAKPYASYKVLSNLKKDNTSLEKIKIAGFVALSWITNVRFWRRNQNIDGLVNESQKEHDLLIQKHLSKSPDSFCINENDQYLKWRINNNPHKVTYEVFTLMGETGTPSLEIIVSSSGNVSFIEQILFDQTISSRVIKKVLMHVIRKLTSNQIGLIRFMGFNSNVLNKNEIKLLKGVGFKFINRGIPFVFKKIGDLENNIDSNSLFITRLFTQGNL
jgi:hypothetical protein